jgi:hypothetical protein
VRFERVGPAVPGLIRVAQAGVKGEFKPGRVSADTADRYGDLPGADQHHVRRY